MATIEDPLGLVGTTIDDKYIVEAVVGEGGFAVVYRATHKLWQKPVAIKCFKTLMDASPALREKLLKDFVQEGALLTELSARSASIVQARDIGTLTTKDGAWVPFMVLEWLEGKTLDGLIEEGGSNPWTVDLTMAILEPVALGLDLAHRRNIAHRDIKPANIFIVGHLPSYKDDEAPPSGEMHVKLLDFGIAKVVQSAADQGFTKTGGQVTSFTPQYGAPEQFSRARGATGPWTDVYSLALIFSEMTSGKLALEGEDFIQLGMSSADPNRRPTPRTLGAKVNDAVEAVSAKALALKPQDRFQSTGEYWNALREALGHAPMKRTATTPVEMPDGPASRASR
ncbi:MAG: serine/threonine-protein kinase, partial [Polyangiales bacterium]